MPGATETAQEKVSSEPEESVLKASEETSTEQPTQEQVSETTETVSKAPEEVPAEQHTPEKVPDTKASVSEVPGETSAEQPALKTPPTESIKDQEPVTVESPTIPNESDPQPSARAIEEDKKEGKLHIA